MERTAVVVGGGIGGLATAAGLIRAGWSVTVFERAAEFTEVGAGISLWPNAFRALDALGLGDRVRALGASDVNGAIRDDRGRQLARPNDSAISPVMLHRAELMGALLDAVPAASLSPGTTVHSVRTERGRGVVEHNRGQSTVDLVVGADGIRSTVRGQLWRLAAPPSYSGFTSWRMIIPMPNARDLPSGESWGPGGLFGVISMSGDRVYAFASAAMPAGLATVGGELSALRKRFGDWHDPIPALLERATPDLVLRHDLYHLPPLESYVSGPVALVGDAAHAMTPNLGQGACQSLEDAVTLVGVLTTESTVDTALRRYDELRRPRTQTIARRSRAAGRLSQLRSPVAIAVRNAAMRLVPRSVFARSITSVLDWSPPNGVLVA